MDQDEFLAHQAVKTFLGPNFRVSMAIVSGGISGGAVYRCTTEDGVFALRCWPENTPVERVQEVHRVQRYASLTLPFVPELVALPSQESSGDLTSFSTKTAVRTYLVSAGRCFELSKWMPGDAFDGDPASDFFVKDSLNAVREGASAIANFHKRTELLGIQIESPPAVRRRWERLKQLEVQLPEALAAGSHLRGHANNAVLLLANYWREFQHSSEEQLRPWLTRSVPTSWVLRDIHREHIYFLGEQVSGMVDFDAVNHDTKATDLARWVGSFADLGLPRSPLWTAAIEGYRQQHEISPCEQGLAGAIEKASWYILLANWVIWSSKISRTIPGGLDVAERRIKCLLRRSHAEECR